MSLTIAQAKAAGYATLEEVRQEQERTKPFWSKYVRTNIEDVLRVKGTFSANDLVDLDLPVIHPNLIGAQTSGLIAKGYMRKVGHTTSIFPSRHGAEIKTYEITELGRKELGTGLDVGSASPTTSSPNVEPGGQSPEPAAKERDQRGQPPEHDSAEDLSLSSVEPAPPQSAALFDWDEDEPDESGNLYVDYDMQDVA